MAAAPNLPLQDGSALVGEGQAPCPADAEAAARGAQPHAIPIEDDTMAASTPQRRGAGSARSTGAMGRTRSREEREGRRRALPAIADRVAEAAVAVPPQGPRTIQLREAFARLGPGPAEHHTILIDVLRGELHAAMQLVEHREAWWRQGMRNAEVAVGSELGSIRSNEVTAA